MSAPTAPRLYVLAAPVRSARCAEVSKWMAVWKLHRDADGWTIRMWSQFDDGWIWQRIRQPERIGLDGSSGTASSSEAQR